MVSEHCAFCVTRWVDRALVDADVPITDLERRRLIAALLSRPHLLLSGPPGSGKIALARALALTGVAGERERICLVQGHPWWAAHTANIGRFVELQTEFSLWRLANFLDANGGFLPGDGAQRPGPTAGLCAFVACVERASPVEIELYFRVVAEWLLGDGMGASQFIPLRLVGTIDSVAPPDLDERIRHVTALVHLGGITDLSCPDPDFAV